MRHSTLYQLSGPKTLRRGSKKILGKWGDNLQNVEKSLRAVFLSDGWTIETEKKCLYWLKTGDTSIFTDEELSKIKVLLQADQSGAEALIVAYDCEPGNYRQLFIHNVSPHVYVAMKLFKDVWTSKMKEQGGIDIDIDLLDRTPISKLKLNPEWKELSALIKESDNWIYSERYYYFAKQTGHSGNYDIQEYMFRMNILEKSGGKIALPKDSASLFLRTYRGLFPEIPDRNNRIKTNISRVLSRGEFATIYNMFGFPYTIANFNATETTYKEYYAWLPQSTVGEITRIAFSELYYWIWDNNRKWDILQDNHDSYLVQCPLLEVAECRTKMQEFMNQKLVSPIDGTEFRMKSECNVGFNWAPFDRNNPEKNPLGLRELN